MRCPSELMQYNNLLYMFALLPEQVTQLEWMVQDQVTTSKHASSIKQPRVKRAQSERRHGRWCLMAGGLNLSQ